MSEKQFQEDSINVMYRLAKVLDRLADALENIVAHQERIAVAAERTVPRGA